jgi:HlyD family secretion protein
MRDTLLSKSLLIAALALGAPAFAQTEPVATETAAAPEATLPAITVSTVEVRTLSDRVIASGLVGPVEEVQVAPLIEGQPIETLEADVGDFVQAGQVLARLSTSTLALQKSQFDASLAAAGATIAQAEAQLIETKSSAAEARRVADRTAKLRQQGSASQAQADTALANAVSADARVMVATQSLEAARAQLALAEAQLANIKLQVERTEVKAPVAGKVVERNALVGGVASAAGQPMFVLIRDGALELRADVAERDLLRLAPGQTALLRSAGSTTPLKGTIRLVEPTIDGTTRLGRARITVEASDSIRAGMFVEADILVATRDVVAVPVTAVGSSAEGTTVMKVTDGQVSRTRVETGIRENGFVEIVSGLSAGDMVVTKAGAFVRDGDRVNPVADAAGTN